jgi:hypothetical protein
MTGSRIKLLVLLVSAAFAALTLGAWTQTWFTLTLDGGQTVAVVGSIAAPALTALALSQLVLVGAIAIAGPFFRVVLGVLQVLLGLTIALSAGLAVASPVAASAAAVTTATGIAGTSSIEALVTSVAWTAWPILSLAAGLAISVLGVVVLVTGRRWPGSTRKYQAIRVEPVASDRSSVDDWDSLTRGGDPTQ